MKVKNTMDPASPRTPHGIPWWVYVMLAIGSYCLLRYVVPELHLGNPALQQLTKAAPTFAPPASILFLLLAAKRLYDTDRGEEESGQAEDKDANTPEEK